MTMWDLHAQTTLLLAAGFEQNVCMHCPCPTSTNLIGESRVVMIHAWHKIVHGRATLKTLKSITAFLCQKV